MIVSIPTQCKDVFFIIDEADKELILSHKTRWTYTPEGYARAHSKILKKPVYLHKVLMPDPTFLVDHIDRNKLNCTRANLRYVTSLGNARNKSKCFGNSRYKGVCYQANRGKWTAQITVLRKKFHLGCFEYEEDAARAYDREARCIFGEHAKLNFPL